MRTRLEIVSKLVEDKHITFEEGLMLMEPVKHPLTNSPNNPFNPKQPRSPFGQPYCQTLTNDPILCTPGSSGSLLGPTDEYR